jgi:hypothetical protein
VPGGYALDVSRNRSGETETWLPFRNAQLCLDCESVFAGAKCPACASNNFVPLSRWIQPLDSGAPPVQTEPSMARAAAHAPASPLSIGLFLLFGVVLSRFLLATMRDH